MNDLTQCVIDLHNIARQLEEEFEGPGKLSEDIRACANRLNDIIKRVPADSVFKCNVCNWVGEGAECDTDDNGDLVCPLCGDHDLEVVEIK